MPVCPFCNQQYYGSPNVCPSCHKALNNKQNIRVSISNSNRNDDIGEKIKTIANILLWIGILSTVICAFVFANSPVVYYHQGFDFWTFLIVLIVGGLSSYVSYMLMCGFSTLIESNINTENNSAESLKLLEKLVIMQQEKESK